MLDLRIYPDPILRVKMLPVVNFDPDNLSPIVDKMAELMYNYKGIGIAAPQIGICQRICVFDIGEGKQVLINPEIMESEGEDMLEEGCLSIPGIRINIKRAKSIVVRGYNIEGKEEEFKADGLLARVIQHEVDHLNGILVVDKLPPSDRLKFHLLYKQKTDETKPGVLF
ncbi:MAG TPA: peptide deformylase [bacterium (Candidatus Stahlbacteria)]|nr:peptide deformylase [Candidatus Stahlbacteria bacterium]